MAALVARSVGRLATAAIARCPAVFDCHIGKPIHLISLAPEQQQHQWPSPPWCCTVKRGFISTSRPRHGIVCFKLADIGEGIAQVELTKWYKKVGDIVEEMEEVCEVQSDKAAVEISSRYSGKIVKVYCKEGDVVKVGGPLIDIDSPDAEDSHPSQTSAASAHEESKPAEMQATEKDDTSRAHTPSSEGLASPAVRRFAKENGVDLRKVTGTGTRGTITKDDIIMFLGKSSTSNASPEKAKAASPAGRSTSYSDRQVVLQGFSKAMAKSMTESLKVPHMNIGDEYDISRLTAVRRVLNQELTAQDIRLSLTAFLIKAISIGIQEYPVINSKFNTATQNSYTELGSHNVSIAIDAPAGLVVPSVKNVQDLTLVDIQRELLRLQNLANQNRLSPADLSGGTISLSNVGTISGTYIKPVLFDGQAVIVGVGRVQRIPRFVERESDEGTESTLEPRDIVNCSFSADHRHCDGATVARFSKRIKSLLENPELMLMYMK